MSALLVSPILIPLVAATVSALLWRSLRAQRALAVVAAGGLLAAALRLLIAVRSEGVLAVQLGDWPAPHGITFVADLLGALMVTLAALIGLAVTVYSLFTIDEKRERFGYYPLLEILLAGVCGAFLTGDLFNLYVWFEVMLIASFVLLALGGEKGQLAGAVKYVALNLLASALFLAGTGILYGMTGTLNLADLARLPATATGPWDLVSMLFLVAFGIKAAAFPFFFWLPASYHTPPAAVSAVFAGLLTKVGVYALIRVFTLVFFRNPAYTHNLILIAALFTMVTGVLGAAAQGEIRRILSFHIVSQIGYMILGLALFTPLALAGSIFYIAHHIVVKTNLFLVGGLVERLGGSPELAKLGGLASCRPWLGVLFLVPALSLAGLPPLSGFFGKLLLVRAGLETGHGLAVFVALVVGLLTLFSMTKIWNEAFWKARPGPATDPRPARLAGPYLSIVALASVTVLIGLAAQPLFELSRSAAHQLLDRGDYVRAVLGEAR